MKDGGISKGEKLFAGGDPLVQRKNNGTQAKRPVEPVRRPVVSRPAQPARRPVAVKPVQQVQRAVPKTEEKSPEVAVSNANSAVQNEKEVGSAKDIRKTKNGILIVVGALVALIVIVLVVLLIPHDNGEDPDGGVPISFDNDTMTREEKETTKEVVEKYAEVKVEGMEEYEDELGKHNAIDVTVKNISEETVSIAVDLGAYSKDGELLDKSSLYAEGIAPGQMYSFQTFVYSKLSREELKSADIKVYKAYTYVPAGSGETIEVEDSVDVVPEVSE